MALLHSPRIVTNGLVLCLDAANRKSYPGSGTVWRDLVGRGINGALTNGPTFSSANGGSIVLDGVNDHIRIGAVTSSLTRNISYSIWFSLNSLNAIQTLFWDDDAKGGGDAWVRVNVNGSISSHRDGDGFGVLSTPAQTVALNNWYNFTITNSLTPANKSFYLNGQLIISNNIPIASRLNRSYVSIGANFGQTGIIGGGGYLNGKVSTFSIYGRSLTPAEIQQNYNATKGRYNL